LHRKPEIIQSPVTKFERLWHLFFPEGVQKKDLFWPMVTLVLLIIVCFETFQVFQSQKYDSDLVNLSGRQRMLLQQYFRVANAPTDQEKSNQTLLSLLETAKTLRYGGRILSSNEHDRWVVAEYNQDKHIQVLLDKHIHFIEGLLTGVQSIDKDQLKEKKIDEALADASEIVQYYVEAAQEHLRKAVLMTLGLTVFLGLLGLLLSRLMFERRIQFEQLILAKEEAIRASYAKTQFLANMSHEIRTPLNAIIGMTDILQETELNHEQSRFVKTLRRAGDNLLSLINDILDLSKVESGQAELDLKEVDLVSLIDRLGELMALRAHQKGLELTCYLSPDVPSYIMADETKLRQILTNLLSNAIKFTSSGEVNLRIDLDSKNSEKPNLKFSVSDTGIGIPANKMQIIFDKFSQADSSISVDYGGTGLGLAISKNLAELMNGKISVKSNIGVGSTFYFEMPYLLSKRKGEKELSLEALAGKRVLIVDDNGTNRFIIHKYLEAAALTIHEAQSGLEALDRIDRALKKNEPYDIILLDFRMPGLSGIAVAECIRNASLADQAIIMLLTSDGKASDPARLNEIGISEFMIKPIRRREFLETVLRSLDQQSQKNPAASQDPKKLGTPQGTGRKILIVDDIEDNRFVVAAYLQNTGFVVHEAATGQQALDLCKIHSYDLIFMDMRMSPLSGYETTKALRDFEKKQNRKPSVVLALTAHVMKHEIESALDAGCNSHLLKPVTRNKIFESIQHYMNLDAVEMVSSEASPIIPKLDGFLKPRLPGYIKSVQEQLDQLTQWNEGNDFDTIERFAHNILGTAGIYGLDQLGEIAGLLEQTAKKKNRAEVADLQNKIQKYVERIQV